LRHFFDKSERQTLPTSKNGSLATMWVGRCEIWNDPKMSELGGYK
jgi:hypothetical protein